MKVLIIEDERTLAREMKIFLEKAFYLCNNAYTAGQAKQLMEQNEYDFILLDLGLPDKDGLELLNSSKKMCAGASDRKRKSGGQDQRIGSWSR
jgi:two-component system, OmpR family, response regulator